MKDCRHLTLHLTLHMKVKEQCFYCCSTFHKR